MGQRLTEEELRLEEEGAKTDALELLRQLDGPSGQRIARMVEELRSSSREITKQIRLSTQGSTLAVLFQAVKDAQQVVNAVHKVTPIACEKGCTACCYLRVEIHEYEAYGLASYLIDGRSLEEGLVVYNRLVEHAELVASLKARDQLIEQVPCPFLYLGPEESEKGACSIYPVRPMACVTYHSLDRSACYQEDRVEDLTIPFTAEIKLGLHGITLGVLEAMGQSPRKGRGTQLSEALLPAIAQRLKTIHKAKLKGK